MPSVTERGRMPSQWRSGVIGKIIRYRFGSFGAWQLGLCVPDRDAEDSCGDCCIRVCDFCDEGEGLVRSQCLRFASLGPFNEVVWDENAHLEVTDLPTGAYKEAVEGRYL